MCRGFPQSVGVSPPALAPTRISIAAALRRINTHPRQHSRTSLTSAPTRGPRTKCDGLVRGKRVGSPAPARQSQRVSPPGAHVPRQHSGANGSPCSLPRGRRTRRVLSKVLLWWRRASASAL
ncbi:hypothetical protein T484DRAFT_1986227 [Baffinella frigidus]|nr:hypothetical protein T484DRAFT_1986227 [Cryptophyta sp. CCMP2293]